MSDKALLFVREPRLQTWLEGIFSEKHCTIETVRYFDDIAMRLARNEYAWVILCVDQLNEELTMTLQNILSVRPYTRFILISPDAASVDTMMPRIRKNLGSLETPKSESMLRRELENVFMSFRGASNQEGYEPLIKAAKLLIQEKRFDEAYERATDALKRDPSRPDAFNLLGILNECLLDRKESLRYYRAALSLDPGFEPARHNLEEAVKEIMPRNPTY